jgi:hypothetical protein
LMGDAARGYPANRRPRPPFQARKGTAMPVYASASASRDDIDVIQATVADHSMSSGDGRCVRCKVEAPCAHQYRALLQLHYLCQLPRRRPMATRPELIGARRVQVRG